MVEAKVEVKVKKVSIALRLLPVFTRAHYESVLDGEIALRCRNRPQALTCFHTFSSVLRIDEKIRGIREGFNRPQALTCFHTAAVFNAENLCLFKLQNTNLPHSEACLEILLHF